MKNSRIATSQGDLEIVPLGDCAVLVRVHASLEASDEALNAVLAVQHRLQAAAIPGVLEITTAFTTVALFYEPVEVAMTTAESTLDSLQRQICGALATTSNEEVPGARADFPTVVIPVCYEAEFALDLHDVSRHTGLSPAEVTKRHASGNYRVHCIGFTPGFPYLGGLPPELATPRRASPRTHVPAGSVAIGGGQTGIYPLSSPGGWHIVGRTPWELFSVERAQPAMLRAGQSVLFRPITTDEFHSISADGAGRLVQASANK